MHAKFAEWIEESCPINKLPKAVKTVSFDKETKIFTATFYKNVFNLKKLLPLLEKKFPSMNVRVDRHGINIGKVMYEKNPDFHLIGKNFFKISKNANGKKVTKLLSEWLKKQGKKK